MEGAESPQGWMASDFFGFPKRWPGKSAQDDKWNFCLNAAIFVAEQETR